MKKASIYKPKVNLFGALSDIKAGSPLCREESDAELESCIVKKKKGKKEESPAPELQQEKRKRSESF